MFLLSGVGWFWFDEVRSRVGRIGTGCFLFWWIILSLVRVAILTLPVVLIAWWIIGFPTSLANIVFAWAITILNSFVLHGLASVLFALLRPHTLAAVGCFMICVIFSNTFSLVYVRKEAIESAMRWVSYASPQQYAVHLFAWKLFSKEQFLCRARDNVNTSCSVLGDTYLNQQGFTASVTVSLVIMCLVACFLWFIFALLWTSKSIPAALYRMYHFRHARTPFLVTISTPSVALTHRQSSFAIALSPITNATHSVPFRVRISQLRIRDAKMPLLRNVSLASRTGALVAILGASGSGSLLNTHALKYKRTHAHTHKRTQMHTHKRTQTHTHKQTQTNTNKHTNTHSHARTDAYTYTRCIHTRIHTQWLQFFT